MITTDGMENASRKYSADKVKKMIENQKEKYGWEFLFLGANIDAVETAGRLGIGEDRAAQFHNDSAGHAVNFEAMCDAVTDVRCGKALSRKWKSKIEEDYRSR